MRFGRRGSAGQPKEAGSEIPHPSLGDGLSRVGDHVLHRDSAVDVATRRLVVIVPVQAGNAVGHRHGVGRSEAGRWAIPCHFCGIGRGHHQDKGDNDACKNACSASHDDKSLALRRDRVDCHSAVLHPTVKMAILDRSLTVGCLLQETAKTATSLHRKK